jgi:hypothetical protein
VLRGLHIGELDAGGLLIQNHSLLGATNQDIIISTQGDGKLVISTDVEMLDSNLLTSDVDVAGGPVKFVKVFVDGTAYAMPLYAIN